MNDNNFRQADLSRALTEALYLAHGALQSEAFSLKNTLETDPTCKEGHLKEVIEQIMHESFEALHVIRDTINRRGHHDVVKRLREHEPWLRNP